MNCNQKICIVSTSRADYGLLRFLIDEIHSDPLFDLQLVVAGMHLAPEFGFTISSIREERFPIHQTIDFLIAGESETAAVKSLGVGLISFADYFRENCPDLIIVLGDRYELLSVVAAALLFRIPIAHIHGGELTAGAVDDSIRHSITKMSNLHFVSCDKYRERVIQLGENPEYIFNVGALGLDYIENLPIMTGVELENLLGLPLRPLFLLVTYHPVTAHKDKSHQYIIELLSALSDLKEATIIFTGVNADMEYMGIKSAIEKFVHENTERSKLFTSLGNKIYLNLVMKSDIVIGNSSSGVIEAPFLKKPVINIGTRQDGREKCSYVVSCKDNRDDIQLSINHVLSKEFTACIKNDYPYGEPGAAKKIKEILKNVDFNRIRQKKFYDIS